jgi:hypothetical protein
MVNSYGRETGIVSDGEAPPLGIGPLGLKAALAGMLASFCECSIIVEGGLGAPMDKQYSLMVACPPCRWGQQAWGLAAQARMATKTKNNKAILYKSTHQWLHLETPGFQPAKRG